MRIAAENDRNLILLTQTQNLKIIGHSPFQFPPARLQTGIVYLQQRPRILRRQHYRLEKQVSRPVPRMTDNVRHRIAYGINHPGSILLHTAAPPANRMNAGNAKVKHTEIPLILIQPARRVKNVQLRTQQQPHLPPLPRNNVKIAKIHERTRPRNRRRVFSNAKTLQSEPLRLSHHLRQRTESMPGNRSMSMNIQLYLHRHPV